MFISSYKLKFWLGVATLMVVATLFLPPKSVFASTKVSSTYLGSGQWQISFPTVSNGYSYSSYEFIYPNIGTYGSGISGCSISWINGICTFNFNYGVVPSNFWVAFDDYLITPPIPPLYYAILSVSGTAISDSSDTRIISVTPNNGVTVSASSSPIFFSTDIYVNASDTPVTVVYSVSGSASVQQCADVNCAFNTGTLSFSTTTSIVGTSTISWSVASTDPSLGLSFFGRHVSTVSLSSNLDFWTHFFGNGSSLLTSTSTTWVYSYLSGVDQAQDQIASTSRALLGAGKPDLTVCSPFSGNFDVAKCLSVLLIPTSAQLTVLFTNFKNGVLDCFPFGYVTRFISIVSGSTVSQLPSLTESIPAGFPGAGATLNLTPWGKLMGPGSYLATATSTQTGHTFYSTFSVYWSDFIYFVFGVMVCLEILNLNGVLSVFFGGKSKASRSSSGSGSVNVETFQQQDKKRMLRDLFKR